MTNKLRDIPSTVILTAHVVIMCVSWVFGSNSALGGQIMSFEKCSARLVRFPTPHNGKTTSTLLLDITSK